MPIKLAYHQKLYLSKSIQKKNIKKMKKQLENKPLVSNVYLITPARNGRDLLEFYSSRMLAQPYYQKEPPYVIGIAATYEEALLLVEQLVFECYEARGDCALREYLSC